MTFDWYRRDAAAWIEVEQRLTLEQAGALNLLADIMHKLGSPLVDADRRIAGILGIDTRKWQAIKRRLIEVGALILEGERIDIPALIDARSERDRVEVQRRSAQEKSVEARKNNNLKIAEKRRVDKRRRRFTP